ncbi:MAG: CoA transferase [Thermoleophilia bacterium]|nr:CoA transferase [Thermoleophilia bacterium]
MSAHAARCILYGRLRGHLRRAPAAYADGEPGCGRRGLPRDRRRSNRARARVRAPRRSRPAPEGRPNRRRRCDVTSRAGDLKATAASEGLRIGPLAGIRVIELGSLLAGPFTGRLLGDMGAEIIKVEAPGQPDPIRDWGKARYEGRSLWWPVQSRNKKCVTLNLREAHGQELLLRLVEQADVVTENFRPGTLERWNIGYEQMSAVNPGIVLARISGYGQTGPYASRAGFASVSEAMGGIRHINGFPGEAPPRMHLSLGDSLAGMFAAQGILSALYWRDAGGGGFGQVVDVSLMEAAFALLESTVPEYDRLGIVRGPQGTNLKGIAPSNIFRSRDEKWMVIAANADGVFRRLCEAIGRPELADDERFATHLARGDNQDEIEGIVADWARGCDAAEIDRILNEAGVICGPIYTIEDIFEDPQFRAREMLLEHVDPEFGPYIGPGIVPKLTRTPGAVRWSATWEEGSHNREVYGGLLGLGDDEVAELRKEGVL